MDSSSSHSLSEFELPSSAESTHELAAGTPAEDIFQPVQLALGLLHYEWDVLDTHRPLVQRAIVKFGQDLEHKDELHRPESTLELVTSFLSFLVHDNQDEGPFDRIESGNELLDAFERDLLQGRNIHLVVDEVAEADQERKQKMVRAYFGALSATGRLAPKPWSKPALFGGDSNTTTYAVFGGITDTNDLLEELRSLAEVYRHVVEPLLKTTTQTLLKLLAEAGRSTAQQYSDGLNFMQWIDSPEQTPSKEYIQSTAVSFPLTGLVQFANYAVVCDQLGLSPADFSGHFRGMTGQSPGMIVAAFLATASDWEDLQHKLMQATTTLFHVGSTAQEYTLRPTIPSTVAGESIANGEGEPSPMLHVAEYAQEKLQRIITALNRTFGASCQVSIGIANTPSDVVVVGPTLSLCALATVLRKLKAPNGTDQTKVAVSKRKPEFTIRFMPTTAPLHSPHLSQAAVVAAQRLSHIHLPPASITLAVYGSTNGWDLRSDSHDLMPALVRMILCESSNLPKATFFRGVSHVVDFGPGGNSGMGSLIHRSNSGSGLRTILASSANELRLDYGYRTELLGDVAVTDKSWLHSFGPSLTTLLDGSVQISNRMTSLLGLPPFMVAGMTPTTASWQFASAITNAGYHVELAAGGLHSAEAFTHAVSSLVQSIPQGRGICVNVIYANPRQIKWQIPLIQRLRSQGQPIDGITFGAGVPSLNVVQEYIDMGLRYISFKPGSALAIQQVIEIAQANKDFPILLQWTGGRGGGHHSYEDFHVPILEWYGSIRQCPNIVLLAGSGFGGADDTYPYISGSWSLAFERPAMPFDGVLFGSRMMVAKEAKTSRGAKEAIVAAPGVADEASWEQSYSKPCGGIVTVKSEMGEPIHKVATRGVLLWKELDETVFSINDKFKRLEKLNSMRTSLIERLNKDYQKVWFGCDSQGEVVDLEDMTYAEVLRRLVQLLYVSKERRWIDPGHMQLTADFVERMYSHLPNSRSAMTATDFGLESPLEAIDAICEQCCEIADRTISYRDARYFVMSCKQTGRKPPTFVPAIDDDFEHWFKKDSLWQSEDLAAVVDEDAGRTCILQGPVAARYSTVVDEPVQQILDTIHRGHVSGLLRDRYGNNDVLVPSQSLPHWTQPPNPAQCTVYQDGVKIHFQIPSSMPQDLLPNEDEWFQSLAGRPGTWFYDTIMCREIMQDAKSVANPIRRVLSPTAGMHVEVTQTPDGECTELALHDTGLGYSSSAQPCHSFTISKEQRILATLHIRENPNFVPLPMVFKFTHHPDMPLHPIHEVMEGRSKRVQDLYSRLWLGTSLQSSKCHFELTWTPSVQQAPIPRIKGQERPVSDKAIQAFAESVQHSRRFTLPNSSTAGIDFGMIVGWQELIKAIFAPCIDGQFLDLVHLSNELALLNDGISLAAGDLVSSCAQVTAIRDEAIGRTVQVEATISKGKSRVVRITSEFLFRESYADSGVCFEKKRELPAFIHVDSPAKAAVLKSKDWIRWIDPSIASIDLIGEELIFEVENIQYLNSKSNNTQVWGTLYGQDKRRLGLIRYQQGKNKSNSPLEYLRRHTSPVDRHHQLEHPQPLGADQVLEFTTPSSNVAYGRASGDFNPIHTSLPFAKYAGLPGTITHGMWSSAVVREQVEKAAGCNERVRMRSYKISFLGMLLPGATVRVVVNHVAMKQGRRVLAFEAYNVATDEKVVGGEAIVDQPTTAYMFTGQGSQQVGMGMELYASCDAARAVWDRADRFYLETYGFRISDVVRRNPKNLTIHFGGRRGEMIKKNYMDIKMENNGQLQQVLSSVQESSSKYVFQHSDGLLFSTVFAQPALTVVGHAQYQHLRSRGLIAEDALFAGHSLGEYTAVSTIGQVLSFERVLAVNFFRALIMNSAVTRNAQGQSQFGMVAINPSRISSHIDTSILRDITDKVAASTGELLEVVNYNVETQQYVATGSLKALACLSAVTDQLATQKGKAMSNKDFCAVIGVAAAKINAQKSPIVLKRGVATVPLSGVDVPFHSTYLLPRMPAFRHVLETYIPGVDAKRLVGKWVNNVTGQPFDISREAIRQAYEKTESQVLGDLLTRMERSALVQAV